MRTDRTIFEFKNGWLLRMSDSPTHAGLFAIGPAPDHELVECPGGAKDDDLLVKFAMEISQRTVSDV